MLISLRLLALVICLLTPFVLDVHTVLYRRTEAKESEDETELNRMRSVSEAVVGTEVNGATVTAQETSIASVIGTETGTGGDGGRGTARGTADTMVLTADMVTATATVTEIGTTRIATAGERGMTSMDLNATTTTGSNEKEVRLLTTYPHRPHHPLRLYRLHHPLEIVLSQFVPLTAKKVTGMFRETLSKIPVSQAGAPRAEILWTKKI